MALNMTTGNGGEMGKWVPLIYRGDGAWIGVMPGGEIGVGVEAEGRASLKASGYIPMWPFMERSLSDCLDELHRAWEQSKEGGAPSPESLVEMTASSAWASGRQYWMLLAASWVIEMAQSSTFDRQFIQEILGKMSKSGILPSELRDKLRHASSKFARGDG
jgi:hypothetical protein